MKKTLITSLVLIFLWSCQSNDQSVAKDTGTMAKALDGSLFRQVADLPIHIDSTDYLIHPIGDFRMNSSGQKIEFLSSYESGSFSKSRFDGYRISGDLVNLKFQKIGSDSFTSLTSENIRIFSVQFLNQIFETTQRQFLLYQVVDRDSNSDGKLNGQDLSALYISSIDGTDFTKLTNSQQQLMDWKEVKVNSRIYFRSSEDSNQNGEFDQEDQIFYQYVDFSNPKPKVISYEPTSE